MTYTTTGYTVEQPREVTYTTTQQVTGPTQTVYATGPVTTATTYEQVPAYETTKQYYTSYQGAGTGSGAGTGAYDYTYTTADYALKK